MTVVDLAYYDACSPVFIPPGYFMPKRKGGKKKPIVEDGETGETEIRKTLDECFASSSPCDLPKMNWIASYSWKDPIKDVLDISTDIIQYRINHPLQTIQVPGFPRILSTEKMRGNKVSGRNFFSPQLI